MRNKPARPAELPIPASAKRDRKAREMIRAWIAEGDLWCTINVGTWAGVDFVDESTAWGILLSDVAHHVANALHEEHEVPKQETLNQIRLAWDREFEGPTSGHNGQYAGDDE
ncbi:MAG: DUF5076 domain-containing protein [Planctomycetes bacterium]|nr:DUF5076 domain-containing protein [Planctomycetota bacterium]